MVNKREHLKGEIELLGRIAGAVIKAETELSRLRSEKDPSKMPDQWISFVEAWRTGFKTLRSAQRVGPLKGWCDGLEREVKDDPILQYLKQSRNVAVYLM